MEENTQVPPDSSLAETPAEETAVSPEAPAAGEAESTPEAPLETTLLDRPRRPRPPFVPTWVPIVVALGVAAIVLVGGGFVYANVLARLEVPKVTGLSVGVAKARLTQEGLALSVSGQRFSSQPVDTILTQTPPPGTKLRRGEPVVVVASAGTEEFALPDVVGDGLLLARGILETKGLELHVEAQPSDQPSNTVLGTNPSPGALVRTGDIVTVSVAATGPAAGTLLPYDMQGVVVDIDPAPVAGSSNDVPLDVARRLRSLIEASGGIVVSLRSLADTGAAASAPARASRAATNVKANVAVGLNVTPSGPGGMIAASPAAGPSDIVVPSRVLASSVASELVTSGMVAKTSAVATDLVLGATKAPWTRVQLGSFSSKGDNANFNDPNWADRVARALYRSVGGLYGKKGGSL